MALLLNTNIWPVLGASSRARQTKLEWFATLGPVAFQSVPLLKVGGERAAFIRCPETGVRLEIHENWDISFSALPPADTEIDSRIDGLTLDDLLLYELDWPKIIKALQTQFQLTGTVRDLSFKSLLWVLGHGDGVPYYFAVLNSLAGLDEHTLKFFQSAPKPRLFLPSISDQLFAALLKNGIQFHALDSGIDPGFSTVEKKVASRYRIIQQPKGWKIVFNGSDAFLGPQKGMFIAEYLLKNPPRIPLHALKLEAVAFPTEGDVGDIDLVIDSEDDEKSEVNISNEYSGFNLNKDNAILRSDIVDSIEKMRAEAITPGLSEKIKKDILQQIRDAQAYLQESDPKQKDHASAAQARINKQLTRLLTALRKPDVRTGKPSKVLSDFADHIEKHLLIPSRQFSGTSTSRVRAGVAQTFTYEPQPGVIWTN
ncbi:MAG: hypothetical protein WC047_02490 [Kiritimatiellales bacterium]